MQPQMIDLLPTAVSHQIRSARGRACLRKSEVEEEVQVSGEEEKASSFALLAVFVGIPEYDLLQPSISYERALGSFSVMMEEQKSMRSGFYKLNRRSSISSTS